MSLVVAVPEARSIRSLEARVSEIASGNLEEDQLLPGATRRKRDQIRPVEEGKDHK